MSATKKSGFKGQHGGRRPGAGAPKGNMNALRTGKRSNRVRAMKLALQATPETASVIRGMVHRDDGRVVLLAQTLHFIADLMVLAAGLDQSKVEASRQRLELREIEKLVPTISQSSEMADFFKHHVMQALGAAQALRLPRDERREV